MAEQLVELNVTGMHCNNCALSVHKLLEKRGLKNILVDFAGEEVKFSNNNDADLGDIVKGIEGLRIIKVVDDPATQVTPFYEKVENNFIFCAILCRSPAAAHGFAMAFFTVAHSTIAIMPAGFFSGMFTF